MSKPEQKKARASEVRVIILKEGASPPCLDPEHTLCRGCPGWTFMLAALNDRASSWGTYPLHCAATSLTILRQGSQVEAGRD